MKQCPNCQRNYPNNAAPFCAEDGTRLIETSAADNSGATLPPTQNYFQPQQQQQSSPMPEHSFHVPNTADNSFRGARKSGVLPTVLGIAAIFLSLGGVILMVILANFYTNDNLYSLLLFLCGAIGLAIAAAALFFGYRARKGRAVAVLGIFASLFPLGIFVFSIGGSYADKNGYFDSYKKENSTSESNIPSASNTPRDALIAFTDACQREHYAAVREQMSNSLLEGLEKIAKQKNMDSYKLIQDSFIKPIKADMDNGGQIQTRNEIITGNTATVENTITGRKWDKTKFIIEDGRWKITNN